jgi:hypothetical protein
VKFPAAETRTSAASCKTNHVPIQVVKLFLDAILCSDDVTIHNTNRSISQVFKASKSSSTKMTHYYAATTTKHFSPKQVGVGYIILPLSPNIYRFDFFTPILAIVLFKKKLNKNL